MDFNTLNWLAIVAAALTAFVIGALWYSPVLFGKPWQADAGLSDEEIRNSNMPRTFGLAFLLTLIMSVNLALFLNDPSTTTAWAVTAGFLAGIWIVAGLGIIYLFEHKPVRLFLINGGYLMVMMLVMGLVLGLWR